MHVWELRKSILQLQATWQFHTVAELWEIYHRLRWNRLYVTYGCLTMLFEKSGTYEIHKNSSNWPSRRPSYQNIVCEREYCPRNKKRDGWVPRTNFSNPSWQSFDATLMSLFLFESKFSKMSFSSSWTVASCSKCTNHRDWVPRVRKWKILVLGYL